MQHYDVAIVGEGFGGLVAAALLCASGKKVILLNTAPSQVQSGGANAVAGFRFPSGPALTYGYEEGGEIRQLIRDLGLREEIPAVAHAYQVALPQRRITVFSDLIGMLDELRREFPRDFPSLSAFYRDLGKEAARISKNRLAGFFARRSSADRFLAKYAFSPDVISFFDVQSLFFFQKPVAQLSLSALIRLCKLNPCQFYGGLDKLSEDLRTFALSKNAVFQDSGSFPGSISRQGRSLVIKTSDTEVGASAVLLCRPDTTTLLGHFHIQETVVPVGMERDLLYRPDSARPDEIYILSLSNHNEKSSLPAGMRSLTVAVHGQNPQALQRDVTGRIEEIVPFFSEFALRSEISPSPTDVSFPSGIAFKPLLSGMPGSLAFKASIRRLYLLEQRDYAPLQVIQTVRHLIKQMM